MQTCEEEEIVTPSPQERRAILREMLQSESACIGPDPGLAPKLTCGTPPQNPPLPPGDDPPPDQDPPPPSAA